MPLNLKSLSLALLAILAMGTVYVSLVSASSDGKFHSHAEHTFMSASAVGKQVFNFAGSEVTECNKVSLNKATSTALGSSGSGTNWTKSEITVGPEFSECTTVRAGEMKFMAFLITSNCHFLLKAATNKEGHAQTEIKCDEGNRIEIKITALKLNCLWAPNQTVTGLRYENTGSTEAGTTDIDVNATVTGITSETKGSCGSGTHTSGTYSGKATAQAEDTEGKNVAIWVE